MMFTEPASKVSVPLTVVTRTLSTAAAAAIEPEDMCVNCLPESASIPLPTQVFPEIWQRVKTPPNMLVAAILPLEKTNPEDAFIDPAPAPEIELPIAA
jgi:hypothetical protein